MNRSTLDNVFCFYLFSLMMTFSRFLQVRACSRTSIFLAESDCTSYSALTGTKYWTSNFKGGFVWVRGLEIEFTMAGVWGWGETWQKKLLVVLVVGISLYQGRYQKTEKEWSVGFLFFPFSFTSGPQKAHSMVLPYSGWLFPTQLKFHGNGL